MGIQFVQKLNACTIAVGHTQCHAANQLFQCVIKVAIFPNGFWAGAVVGVGFEMHGLGDLMCVRLIIERVIVPEAQLPFEGILECLLDFYPERVTAEMHQPLYHIDHFLRA